MIVKLIVRCVSGMDVEIECRLDWSVLQVKEEIEKRVETHPKPDEQRLVYAGKVLENFSLLQHVLRMEDDIESHTVHLVCKQMFSNNKPQQQKQQQQQNNVEGLRQRPQQQQQPESSGPVHQQQHHQHHHNFDAHAWAEALRQHQMNFSQNHEQSHDQNYWLNHMYAQYMTHYMQYLQTAGTTSTTFTTPNAEQFFPHPPVNNNNGVAPAPPQVQPPANAQAQNDMVMNAGAAGGPGAGGALGAMEDDEELGGQRDVLDWFYVASRVLVLFSIVYFYSSLARFALVTMLGFAAYMWNVGFFRRRNNNNADNNNNVNQEEIIRRGVAQVRQDATGEANRNVQEGEDENEEQQEQQQDQQREEEGEQQQQENQSSPLATTFTFISTFFTSLLPEQPQVV